jgi:beta-galactosidase/beta-glucuronidase
VYHQYTTDIDNSRLNIRALVGGDAKTDKKLEVEAVAYYDGKNVGSDKVVFNWRSTNLTVNLSELHLWEPGHGRLYDLDLFLYADGELIDSVKSYFGMRTIGLSDRVIYINNKPVFQRLVLDQGFYPDGIYTAPTDEALKKDIIIAMEAGFNGARLHEKIFEPRFLYWADKLGYIVWGEHANWGLEISKSKGLEVFMNEWMEAIERDINHPSIVGWCPFNETQENQNNNVIDYIYCMTKMLDPTRPVIDSSGWHHVDSDIYDVHDYNQDFEAFKNNYEYFREEGVEPKMNLRKKSAIRPMPFFVSEYGGIWWAPGKEGWGYGKAPEDSNEFLQRYKDLTTYLLKHPKMCGFCYTQLYDVEQEVNGIYTYERQVKFDPKIFYDINTQIAAIEEE